MLRTDKDIERIYHRHVEMLYRVAYSFMKNGADAEDMVQETFIRLLRSGMVFDSVQHEKAWLIVTVSNLCKSALRSPWRRRDISITTIKKLCDGLDITLGEFFSTPEFDRLEQELQ